MHITKSIHPKQKVLSVFSLVMINVIAVDSLRSLAITAEYGFSLLFFYIIGALFFFIPIALVAAELATGWPRIGGIYAWVKEAFGPRWAFVTIWLQWIYNVVWFPTILSFIAVILAYLIDPSLAEHKVYILAVMLIGFWSITIANCFGMEVSAFISTLGAIIGTILPMLFIIALAAIWLINGNPSNIQFNWQSFFPDISSINNLAFFSVILFSLLGVEMSAVHAEDVKNPQKDYPRALLISAIIILCTLTLGSLAIAIVIPHDEISLVAGLIDAYDQFFTHFGMSWMTPIIALLIILGSIGCVSAWVVGPIKGLLAATEDGSLPYIMQYTTEKSAPIILLLIQASIFTVLCSLFLFMPTVNTSYWILSAMTAQLAMFVYLFMFSAVIRLRYTHPNIKRSYKIPGGLIGVWIIGLAGIMASIAAIIVGFFPPPEIEIENLFQYEAILIGGLIIFCGLPLYLYRIERRLHHLPQ